MANVNVRELIEGKEITGDSKHRICHHIAVIRSIYKDIERYGRRKDLLWELSDTAYEILQVLGEEEDILYNVEYKKYEDIVHEENIWIWGISTLYHFRVEPDADKCETVKLWFFPLY